MEDYLFHLMQEVYSLFFEGKGILFSPPFHFLPFTFYIRQQHEYSSHRNSYICDIKHCEIL